MILTQNSEKRGFSGVAVFLLVAGIVVVACTQFGDTLTIQNLAQQESQLRAFQQEHPVLVYGAAFLIPRSWTSSNGAVN